MSVFQDQRFPSGLRTRAGSFVRKAPQRMKFVELWRLPASTLVRMGVFGSSS
jgi:hypothetical protein